MNKQKVISYIGFALKARKVIIGSDNILQKRRNYPLILVCSSLSERAKKEISNFAKNNPCLEVENLAELTNRAGCKALAILDENLANAIISVTK